MLSYRVSILSYDSGPKIRKKMPLIVPEWQKNRFPVANFQSPVSCNCMHPLQKGGTVITCRICVKMWRHSKSTDLFMQHSSLFFFSQHRIRTRQYELLLNLTHYTIVSKTSVLSYSKPDIHKQLLKVLRKNSIHLISFLLKSQPNTPPSPIYLVPDTMSQSPSFCFLYQKLLRKKQT